MARCPGRAMCITTSDGEQGAARLTAGLASRGWGTTQRLKLSLFRQEIKHIRSVQDGFGPDLMEDTIRFQFILRLNT